MKLLVASCHVENGESLQLGRKLRVDLTQAVEDGPYPPDEAKRRGLVDEVGYFDDAREALKRDTSSVRDEIRFGAGAKTGGATDLGDLVRVLAGESPPCKSLPCRVGASQKHARNQWE